MDLGGFDGQINKAIDQAAEVAKQKIGGMIGGGDQQKEKKQTEGVGDMISGAIGKAAAGHAVDKATNEAMNFGKGLFK